jgi:hypothetical protein
MELTGCHQPAASGPESEPGPARSQPKTKPMADIIYIAVMALIFVAGELYAHWCEKI